MLGLAAAACWLCACGGDGTIGRSQSEVLEPAQVVARVEGEPIGLDEVLRVAEAAHMAPRLALERLVEARLLERHARSLGYVARSQAEHEAKRAAVRLLLKQEIEANEPAVALDGGLPEPSPSQLDGSVPPAAALNDLRRKRYDAFVEHLRKASHIVVIEQNVQAAIRDARLWGEESP